MRIWNLGVGASNRVDPCAALLDEALGALLARHRACEIDGMYAAYDEYPIDQADEWGDLESFREAAGAS